MIPLAKVLWRNSCGVQCAVNGIDGAESHETRELSFLHHTFTEVDFGGLSTFSSLTTLTIVHQVSCILQAAAFCRVRTFVCLGYQLVEGLERLRTIGGAVGMRNSNLQN